jgi:hypothetical protein
VYVGLSDPFLKTAFWVGIISTLLVLLSVLRIIWLRIALLWQQRQKGRFLEVWRPVIIRWLGGDEAQELPELKPSQQISFLLIWMHFHENLRGGATEALNRLGFKVGIHRFLPDLLRRGDIDKRLIAAAASGHLRSTDNTNVLWHYARQPITGLSLTAVRALCQIHPVRAAKQVVPLMVERTDWPLAKISSILNEAGLDFVHRYIQAMERVYEQSPEKLPRLLRVLSSVELNRPLRLVRRILENDDPPEITAAALRLVCHPDELPLVRARLRDPYWSVRVQAVTRLGVLGGPADIEDIAELLHDHEWWVRYRAAQALKRLPGVTMERLQQVFADSLDPFAKDILAQVAAESGEELKEPPSDIASFGVPLFPHPVV